MKKALSVVVVLLAMFVLSSLCVCAEETETVEIETAVYENRAYANHSENNVLNFVEVVTTEPCVRVKLSNLSVTGKIKEVKFAVWSIDNGQDDLVWYTAGYYNGMYQKDINLSNHKSAGDYNVHCYVVLSDGTMKFLNAAKFNVGIPGGKKLELTGVDINKGIIQVKVSGVENRIGAKIVYVGLKNEEYSKNAKWYKAERTGVSEYTASINLSEFNYMAGTYDVYGSILDLNGEYHGIEAVTCDVKNSVDSISAVDVNGNESQFKISVKNPAIAGGIKSVHIAVWSKEKGQDDLVWYNSDKKGTEYSCVVPISAHKTLGAYNVHVYAKNMNNKMVFMGTASFSVNTTPKAKIKIDYIDKVNGKLMVKITDISAPAGVSNVQVPVWCGNDQSTTKWYKATACGDGSYKALIDISNHKGRWGKYTIFAHISMKNGINGYAGSDYYNLTKNSSDAVSENEIDEILNCKELGDKNGYYRLSLSANSIEGSFSSIEYAVWSNTNGQDDILWFMSEKSGLEYQADVSMLLFKDYGKYNVNAYAVANDGSRVLIKKGEFNLEKPSAGKVEVTGENRDKGTFNVVVSDIKNSSAISKILVGAKSSDKNAGVVWYEAKKSANGEYIATVDIKNHGYATGKYTVYSKISDLRGTDINAVSTSYDFNVTHDPFVVYDYDNTENLICAMVKKLSVPGGFKNIKFAVWSSDKGQDDIRWYGGKIFNGAYYYYVPINNHKTLGYYHVHIYYTSPDGKLHFLGNTGFSINSKAGALVSANNINGTKGTFRITVSDIKALSGVRTVQVPVWSKSDQSDIKWYTAAKQADGTYAVDVKVADHKYNFGTYNAHVYITMGNGIRNFAAATKVNISPLNFLKVDKLNEGKVKLTLMNAGNGKANAVSFPTWSEAYGQDDIKWYSASYAGSGNWTAIVESKNHKNYGKFITHAYVEYNGKKTSVNSTSYNLKGLDFSDLLSRFSTVSQNNANGTFNMTKALLSFNGLVVQPGQTVSFFGVAGPCGKNQGFLVAGTVQGTGYGGGICQASTTLYGGALRAGMTIVERRSHSSRSVYVPVGQDAMVSYGSSDFKFRNDYDRPVKIVTYVNGKTLYVEFWGIQQDWYDNIEVNSWATGASTAAAERIYYKNGVIVKRERLTNSYYPKG